MGLRLSVRESQWHESVASAAAQRPGLIPVVKGNGYGFGRRCLMPFAAPLGPQIAVGSVYEAADVPPERTALVLTPHIGTLPSGLASSAVLTVGSVDHVLALQSNGWSGAVTVKLRSSLNRYGASPDELPSLLDAVSDAGLTPVSYSLHLPLAGGPAGGPLGGIVEIDRWLRHLDRGLPVALGHVGVEAYAHIRSHNPAHDFRIRVGTAIWLAEATNHHLSADVLDVRPVKQGERIGYREASAPADGRLVLVAAGSANGVQPLDGGRSPFHFERNRLRLIEPPHMHTSMVLAAGAQPCPQVGQRVDVQHPLTRTLVDEIVWIR